VRSLVLESSPSLRASGFAFTTWKNAFRALDALGVGDKIRRQHLQAQTYVSNFHVHRARVAVCSQFPC
jgi:2-polyprenyl-6-methoxyphenol hydroxylase-like FAD-dependent oxidoreductase